MQALNDDLESLVATHPDQWFWVHRRWKNLAPGTGDGRDGGDAPFVARFVLLSLAAAFSLITCGNSAVAKTVTGLVCSEHGAKLKESVDCNAVLFDKILIKGDGVVIDATSESLSPPNCRSVPFCHVGNGVNQLFDNGVDMEAILGAREEDLSRVRKFISARNPNAEVSVAAEPGRLMRECEPGKALVIARFYNDEDEFLAYQTDLESLLEAKNVPVPAGCILGGVMIVKRKIPVEQHHGE